MRVSSPFLMVSLAALVAVADQITKSIVRTNLSLYENFTVIPGFLSITHGHNTGVACGFLNSVEFPFKTAVMTGVALTALLAIGVYSLKTTVHQPMAQFGLAMVMGGAIGNLLDRVTAGFVLDFVDVYWGNWHFWAFNVADAGISVGATLLILDMVWINRHVSETF